jgi:hypothetical protein
VTVAVTTSRDTRAALEAATGGSVDVVAYDSY